MSAWTIVTGTIEFPAKNSREGIKADAERVLADAPLGSENDLNKLPPHRVERVRGQFVRVTLDRHPMRDFTFVDGWGDDPRRQGSPSVRRWAKKLRAIHACTFDLAVEYGGEGAWVGRYTHEGDEEERGEPKPRGRRHA